MAPATTGQNKQRIRDFIEAVWATGDLAALPSFWTEDCVNHAAPGPDNRGLVALRSYHEAFLSDFAAFTDVTLIVVQQVAEDDYVVTHLVAQGPHADTFIGIPSTGKRVALTTMRIGRLRDGKIAEHWSVADVAGLMQQLQG